MKNLLMALFAFIFISSVSAQDKQDYKFVHPLPQSNNLRKIKMIDANTWFAVGANGTFMRTTNAGVNWYFHHTAGRITPATATTGALSSTYAYDMWFFNQNTGIVVGDQGYIGRTVNGGVTFDTVGYGLVPSNSRCWGVWFADANTGYIGAGSQSAFTSVILKTTNGGINWTSVYTSATNYINNIGGIDANNVMAAWSNGTVVRTTNGGSNWTETTGGLFAFVNSISFLNSTTGFAVGGSGKASRTTNAGVTWDSINTPTTDWTLFQIKPVSATEVYAIGHPTELYKTTNLGTTWTALTISVPNVYPYIWYSVDKFGSTMIISGDYGLVAKSTDGGTIWSSNNIQYNTQIMNDVFNIPNSGKIWYVGRPSQLNQQVLYTSNNGNNWTPYGTGGTEEFFGIHMINSNTGYVSANNSKVFKTTNGGQNWIQKTNASGTNYSLYSMEFVNENTGWVFVNYSTVASGNVFKTTDGAETWTQYNLATTSPGGIMSADFVDANTGFVTINGSNKPVYKTTNGGINWTPYTTGSTSNLNDIKAVDVNTVYVVATSGTNRVYKSTNGGENWTGIAVPVAADYKSIDFKDANTGYICGNLTTIACRTTNGGNTWIFQNVHLVTSGKIFVTAGDTAFINGGITSILRAPGSTITSVEYNGNVSIKGYELMQNYPNPFNPVTTIEFNLPKAGNVSVKVFDLAGREYLTEINNLSLNPGNFKMNFNGSGLSSGIYFYSLIVNGSSISTKKMMLIK